MEYGDKAGRKCGVKGGQNFFKLSVQIDYSTFCAFTRILTVVLDVGTLNRQTHTISPLAQVPFFSLIKAIPRQLNFSLKGNFSRENLPEIP